MGGEMLGTGRSNEEKDGNGHKMGGEMLEMEGTWRNCWKWREHGGGNVGSWKEHGGKGWQWTQHGGQILEMEGAWRKCWKWREHGRGSAGNWKEHGGEGRVWTEHGGGWAGNEGHMEKLLEMEGTWEGKCWVVDVAWW